MNNTNTKAYYGRFKYEGAPMLINLFKLKVLNYPNIHERINGRAYTQACYPWLNAHFNKPTYFSILNH